MRGKYIVMKVYGIVRGGVVVLDGGVKLPEGMKVSVVVLSEPEEKRERVRVTLPLVDAKSPVHLTNDRIAEILNDQDAESVLKTMRGENDRDA